ncbi:hypothetical protein [Dyadobacter sp. NIV53]|uniref:hypothetical protein n=1 Tax=Dyadobacter sp. NIV53 TaxID=2861765 RepID=UPI001C886F09|nr:hypothetical protein [Dyadobacter sp. NIV53]
MLQQSDLAIERSKSRLKIFQSAKGLLETEKFDEKTVTALNDYVKFHKEYFEEYSYEPKGKILEYSNSEGSDDFSYLIKNGDNYFILNRAPIWNVRSTTSKDISLIEKKTGYGFKAKCRK